MPPWDFQGWLLTSKFSIILNTQKKQKNRNVKLNWAFHETERRHVMEQRNAQNLKIDQSMKKCWSGRITVIFVVGLL